MAGEQTASPVAEVAPRGDFLLHAVLLVLSAGVLLLSITLQIHGHEKVVLPILEWPLPGVCTFKQLAGVECPGCGLTRCFISMSHGEVRRAWHYNPAGVCLFVVVLIQLPYRAVQIARLRRGVDELCLSWVSTFVVVGLVLGLLAQWIVRSLALRL